MDSLITRTKPIRISFNMFCCAIFFCWAGVKPRETLSGLFGRRAANTHIFWKIGQRFIDALHPHEKRHCYETWQCEERMRKALYEND